MVLDGAYEGTLMKQWANYAGPAQVHFQKKHWMDKVIAKKYLRWIRSLYPGKKIGIVWDKAAAHTSDEVLDYAKELGIVIEFVHAGMTSIMQPCDIWLNKTIKTIVKRLYHAFENSLFLKTGEKVIVPREKIVEWMEIAVQKVNDDNKRTRAAAMAFTKCGMNPHDFEKTEFAKHLETLCEDSIYYALINNQTATDLAPLA